MTRVIRTNTISFALSITLCILFIGGCSNGKALATAELLNHGMCKTLTSGLSEVSYQRIAEIRDSRLIGMTTEEQPEQEPDVLLLAVSNGDQPTPGYGFKLADAYLEGKIAVIELLWTFPDEDALLPQMTTHPCIVIGLETTSYNKVQAVDQNGKVLGELTFPN